MYCLTTRVYVAALTMTGLVELNSIFLHLRKLSRVGGLWRNVFVPRDSAAYRLITQLNILTFIVFRLVLLTCITLKMVYMIAAGQVEHTFLHINLFFTVVGLFALSITFFRMLLASDAAVIFDNAGSGNGLFARCINQIVRQMVVPHFERFSSRVHRDKQSPAPQPRSPSSKREPLLESDNNDNNDSESDDDKSRLSSPSEIGKLAEI